ncbi:hypothetical protein D3C76_1550080 [compost metagenome]
MVETPGQFQVVDDCCGLFTELGKIEPQGVLFNEPDQQLAFTDLQGYRHFAQLRQLQRLTLCRAARPKVMALGKTLLAGITGQTAVILLATDLQHLHTTVDQADHRLEALVVERVGE